MAHVAQYRKRGTLLWRCEYGDAGGQRRRKLFRTREAADDFLAETIRQGRQRLDPELRPDIPVREYAAVWQQVHQAKTATHRVYEIQLRVHLLPEFGETAVRDVTRARVKRFLAGKLAEFRAKGREGGPSVRLILAVLHVLLEAAREDQLITVNPALSAAGVSLLKADLAWRKQEKLRRGWREMPVPLFFDEGGGYLQPDEVRRRMKRVLTAAGLAPHYSPHGLRHTYASIALQEG